jgi:hypothetical protein
MNNILGTVFLGAFVTVLIVMGFLAARQEIRECRKLSEEMGQSYTLKQAATDAWQTCVIILLLTNTSLLEALWPDKLLGVSSLIAAIIAFFLIWISWGQATTRKRYEEWRYDLWKKDAKPVRSLFDDLETGTIPS